MTQFSRCFTLLLALGSLLGVASATDVVPPPPTCGSYLAATDIPGRNLHNSGKHTNNDMHCMKRCKNTPGCNVSVRHNGAGLCYLKSVDAATIVPTATPHYNSHILCDNDVKPAKPVKPVVVKCGKWIKGKDLRGRDLPGSGTITKNGKECWKLCKKTDGCNSVARHRLGHCYLKNVDNENVELVDSGAFKSFYKCGKALPPKAPKKKCGKALSGVDLEGRNLAGSGAITKNMHQCKKLCKKSKDGCNAVIRGRAGDCYLKKIDQETAVLNRRSGFTSFMMCPPKMCKKAKLGDECACPKGAKDLKWCNMKKNNPCCKGKCLPALDAFLPDRKLALVASPPKMVCRMPGKVIRPRAKIDGDDEDDDEDDDEGEGEGDK